MGQKLSFLISALNGTNISSFSKIFDEDGNGKLFFRVVQKCNAVKERDGLKLKQGEWNILQMGTTKYETNCKRMRFKNIYVETVDQKTIPLMSDQVPDVSLW